MLQGVLLEPSLARRHELPRIGEPGPEAAAWLAVLDFSASAQGDLTTAGLIQHFAGTAHAGVLSELLASAADCELAPEQAEAQVLGAAERWRQGEDQRALQALLRQPFEQLSAEDRESLTRGLKAGALRERRER